MAGEERGVPSPFARCTNLCGAVLADARRHKCRTTRSAGGVREVGWGLHEKGACSAFGFRVSPRCKSSSRRCA